MDRYVVISSDCHAGADLRDYRPYLEAQYHDEFDALEAGLVTLFDDRVLRLRGPQLGQRDATARAEEDEIVAEMVFPNTIPPFFPSVEPC